ncbi:unknown [Clostridium sp. CAG:448]|nr:unknown [Clostridium sp. CAG:448]
MVRHRLCRRDGELIGVSCDCRKDDRYRTGKIGTRFFFLYQRDAGSFRVLPGQGRSVHPTPGTGADTHKTLCKIFFFLKISEQDNFFALHLRETTRKKRNKRCPVSRFSEPESNGIIPGKNRRINGFVKTIDRCTP